MQIVTLDPLIPPYSSGNGMARIPFSAKSISMSFGYSAFSSISAARGTTLSWTSSRMVSRIASCSSLKSKSMARLWAAGNGRIRGLEGPQRDGQQDPENQGLVVLEVRYVADPVHGDRQQHAEHPDRQGPRPGFGHQPPQGDPQGLREHHDEPGQAQDAGLRPGVEQQ